MLVMKKRRCGTPAAGGLYAVCEVVRGGTLNAFTAIAAPVEAEIQNPRAAEKVHILTSLTGGLGLVPPGFGLDWTQFAGLPRIGMADLWGKATGYKTVWDVITETLEIGITRRIAKVPDVSLPCPVLMMHMDAFQQKPTGPMPKIGTLRELLPEFFSDEPPSRHFLFDQPWLAAESLGRVGDPTYMDHPHVAFWRALGEMTTRKRNKALKGLGARLTQGIFGLTWITAFAQVLAEDQDRVAPELAARGVIPALGPDDPRAQEMEE